MEERRYPGLDVIQCMKLDPAFLLPEQSPLKNTETKVNRSGIKGTHLPSELEYLNRLVLLAFCHNTIGEILEDAAVPVIVRFRQVASCGSLAEAQVKRLACVSLCRQRQVSESFPVGQLPELHYCLLVPTCEGLDILVYVMFL